MTHSSVAGAGFEPAGNTNKIIVWVAVGMLGMLALLLGIAYFLYRDTPAGGDPAVDTTEDGTLPESTPPPPLEPRP
jgi:hypothetical protein